LSSKKAAGRDGVEAEALGDVLGFMRLLWAVAHGLESTSKRMGAGLGVTGPQRLVLRLIGHYSRLSPGDLAQLLHVHPSSLTGVLGRLERSKLLERRRDPSDGRRAILSLTAKGRALNARRAGTVEESVRRALAAQSRSKITIAGEVLTAIARELEPEEEHAKTQSRLRQRRAPELTAAPVARRQRNTTSAIRR
jgi:MarR family transcriptional regulator, organic hydroperoxide resistance regulator